MNRLSKEQLGLISKSIPLSHGQRVVLIDVGGRKDVPADAYNNNVYRVDDLGNIIWQIQADSVINERDSFVYLISHEPGSLKARRFFGNEFTINEGNGVATHVGWLK